MSRDGIVIVGSLNADLVVRAERFPQPGETVRGGALATLPGGKGANQAAAAGRLGGDVRIVGVVGDDANGALLRRSLQAHGVDVSWLSRAREVATGTALITVTDDGENTIVVSPGANAALAVPEVRDSTAFDGCAVLGLSLEIDLDVVTAAAERAHDAGILVMLNLSPFAVVPGRLLELTDVLLVNEHEASLLLGLDVETAGAAEVVAALHGLGIVRAVITRGSAGSLVVDEGEVAAVAAIPVRAVDTTGCGDAFMGALTVRLAAGASLTAAVRFAAAVGAYAATGHGAQSSYPTLEQLRGFLGRYPSDGPE